MAYSLGIDLGTTFVAAAVARDGHVEMFPLGDRSTVMHAVVYVSDDGRLVGGDTAAQRIVSEPDRVAVNIKRSLGNPTPMLIGGTPHTATALLGALLRDVLTKVTEAEGVEPDAIVLTHPANWGKLRRTVFQDVPVRVGLSGFQTVTEPKAAAAYYDATHRLDVGELIAVYDLGGGTFDATVLRRTDHGIEVLGTPEGFEHLGGVDFDEAVVSYVDFTTGGALRHLNMSDPRIDVAVARLRQDCVLAKEALAYDTETTIPVFVPGGQLGVRLTHEQFQDMIRLPIESTLGALSRTLRTAGVTPAELSAVLLVGGCSQIPLVAQMVSQEFDCPAVVDEHPKYAVALGAAILASSRAQVGAADAHEPPSPPRSPEAEVAALSPVAAPAPQGELVAAVASTATAEAGFAPPASSAPRTSTASLPRAAGSTTSGADTRPDYGTTNQPGPPVTDRPNHDSAGQVTAGSPGIAPRPGQAAEEEHRSPRSSHVLVAVVVLVLFVLIGLAVLLETSPDPEGGRNGASAPAVTSAAASAAVPHTTAPSTRPARQVATSVPNPSLGPTIPVGSKPGYVIASPDGSRVYVAEPRADAIAVVDTATSEVTATIPVATGPPQYLTFSPDGSKIYVSVWNEASTIAAVSVLNTTTNAITATTPVNGRPFVSAVTPDGKFLYVPDHDSGTVWVIDTANNRLLTEIRVPPNAHWLEFSPDGKRAYVADHDSDVVTVVDTATNTVITKISVGGSPHSVAVHPTRPLVADVNYDGKSVTVIDTDSDKVIDTVGVGRHPQDVTWSADGRFAYVANVDDDTVSVIRSDDFSVTATIPTGHSPTSVAVLPDGSRGYVSNLDDGTLTVLNLVERRR